MGIGSIRSGRLGVAFIIGVPLRLGSAPFVRLVLEAADLGLEDGHHVIHGIQRACTSSLVQAVDPFHDLLRLEARLREQNDPAIAHGEPLKYSVSEMALDPQEFAESRLGGWILVVVWPTVEE